MSMLAEPRRKQKWTLNPRGKQWSEDSNKFGQKMLEKMGWTSGKGLGASEQGMTEHVKVSYKNNQSGIGFKDRGDQWTQHQADFNDFLSRLQEQNSNPDTVIEVKEKTERDESLELKSKQSRARVHYHKFIRGKDVKKYSQKDLANIFGKKDLKDKIDTSKAKEIEEEVAVDPRGSRDETGGVLTIKGGNIDEYFKNKLPNFVKHGHSNEANDSEGEDEPRLGFGFSSVKDFDQSQDSKDNFEQNKSVKGKRETDQSISGFAFANEGMDLQYQEKGGVSENKNVGFVHNNLRLSPEKRKNSVKKSTIPFSNEGFVNPALNLNDLNNDENNGAEFEVSRVEFGLVNDALDLSDENNQKKRVTFNEKVEYNTDVVKKKKGKGGKGKGKLDKFEVDNSKLKKKAKEIPGAIESVVGSEAEGFVNEALEIEEIHDEINDNEMNERKTKKSKRKKNRRTSSLETIEEIAEEISQIDESEIGEAVLLDETPTRKNKKIKKNPEGDISSELNTEVSEIEIETPGSKKKDKKEKKAASAPEKKSDKKKGKVRRAEESEITFLAEKQGKERRAEESEITILAERKGKVKRAEESEITVLAEISRKISKSKRNKIGNEPENSITETQEETESTEAKKKNKKRSKSKSEGRDIAEIESNESSDQPDVSKSSAATKRKSSGIENGMKLTKRSKIDNQEDTENFEQNRDVSINSIPQTPWDKKDKKSKKTFKSLFAKAPTLYFSGSNINQMAGYGAGIRAIKQ